MNLPISAEKPLLLQAPVCHGPSVVILSSFEPKMIPKHDLELGLKRLADQAEQRLMAAHSGVDAMPVIRILRQTMLKLDYSTHRRAVAIFVSTQVEKICYLDMEVETRVFIDEDIRMRDLSGFRRQREDFLVLYVDDRESRMYLGEDGHLRLIKSNAPQTELTVNQFLHQMDEGLTAVLRLYSLPVFVVGPALSVSHFKAITGNARNIAGYVQKNVLGVTAWELLEFLKSELADFAKVRERIVLQRIGDAAEHGKLVQGLEAVRKAAGGRNGKLLVIGDGGSEEHKGFYKNGVIDEIAEKVLACGGEVEVMDGEGLEKYENLVLLFQR